VLWLRRDLRLSDHPALLAAAADAGSDGEVVALFVLDGALLRPSGPARLGFLLGCLRELDERLDGRLCLRAGDPAEVVPAVARELDAPRVHLSADFGPYGARRDRRVERALAAAGRELVATGSPYAVAPGQLTTVGGTRFRVFTPFYRAWLAHGWPAPSSPAGLDGPTGPDGTVRWARLRSEPPPAPPRDGPPQAPTPGERAAAERLDAFISDRVAGYADARDAPGANATSRLSPYLRFGCVHPRTVLARLGDGRGAETFRAELAWREFYADVLAAAPDSARADLTPGLRSMRYERPGDDLEAWKAGRTGFPIVDAGMRQLLAEGWMHNRVRMIVASFLCKDLHLHWWHGARYFMAKLVDGDLASNNHGWQWVAGTGTDAAPYFRVFNPVSQGRKFDPDGRYIRRYVPELAELTGRDVHEPWTRPGGPPGGYPLPIVDHAEQRREALARYEQARAAG
jgi:deoxyribodipyrimidine photo-lyase